jgi:hypothetical protein
LLTKKHALARKKWADERKDWADEEWDRVVFSDESKFNVWGSDGVQYCRRMDGEAFEPQNVDARVKHGNGNIMVWGCVTSRGFGRLHRVEGRMKKEQYCHILEESFLGTLQDQDFDVSDIIFQQDNDPKHTAKLTTQWFKDHNVEVLPWPANSPDMNIIEHVWKALDDRVRQRERQPANQDDLWAILQEEWEKMDIEYCQALYSSMPRRIDALRKAKGWYTKY